VAITLYSLLPALLVVVNIDFYEEKVYFTAHPDFLAWYEDWLDQLLAGWDLSWFGFTGL
jgi:hypothetical protein